MPDKEKPGKRPARIKPAKAAAATNGGVRGPMPARKPAPAAAPATSEHVEKARGWVESFQNYLRSVRAEFKRVTWPNREQLRAFTLVVIATLVAVTLYLWVVSKAFDAIFSRLTGG